MTRPRLVLMVTDPVTARHLMIGQLSALQAMGFDVTVVSAPGEGLEETGRREGVATLAVPMTRGFGVGRDLVSLVRLTALLRRTRPAIVSAGTPKAGLLGMISAKLARVPVRVYTVRGLRLETTSGATRRVLASTERLAAACASHVICVSESLKLKFVEFGLGDPVRCAVLGAGSSNGVDTTRFHVPNEAERSAARERFGLPRSARVAGFVGRLTRDKGVEGLASAFERVAACLGGTARLLVVGAFEEGDSVPAEVRERLRTMPGVVMPGFSDDTLPCYHAMDVLAFPSHREGFPNAPLEAAATGLPVVGYAATGTVDAVVSAETGTLVPVGDVGALGDALIRYLKDEKLCRSHGAAGRARAERDFRREFVWARWAAFYREQVPSSLPYASGNRRSAGA